MKLESPETELMPERELQMKQDLLTSDRKNEYVPVSTINGDNDHASALLKAHTAIYIADLHHAMMLTIDEHWGDMEPILTKERWSACLADLIDLVFNDLAGLRTRGSPLVHRDLLPTPPPNALAKFDRHEALAVLSLTMRNLESSPICTKKAATKEALLARTRNNYVASELAEVRHLNGTERRKKERGY